MILSVGDLQNGDFRARGAKQRQKAQKCQKRFFHGACLSCMSFRVPV